MAKRDIKFLVNDIKEATVTAAQDAAVEIMNSLSERGPIWTGKLSSAWYALPSGAEPGGYRSEGRQYVYDRGNVPKTSFTAGTLYRIVNGMGYADQARDLVEYEYLKEKLLTGTIKPDRLKYGVRPKGGRRGELQDGAKRNRSTAPLDWYLTYINGGALKKDLEEGAKKGFGTFKPKGFG